MIDVKARTYNRGEATIWQNEQRLDRRQATSKATWAGVTLQAECAHSVVS